MTTTAPDLAARKPGEPITVGQKDVAFDEAWGCIWVDGKMMPIDEAHAIAAAITTLAAEAGHPAPVPLATVALVDRLADLVGWCAQGHIGGCECRWCSALTAARAWLDGQPVAGAAKDVLAERARQISAEGWTPEHDASHRGGNLARAAASYALSGADWPDTAKQIWPWSSYWWKPTNRRRDLVKAGALILAEIERLDRAALRALSEGKQ